MLAAGRRRGGFARLMAAMVACSAAAVVTGCSLAYRSGVSDRPVPDESKPDPVDAGAPAIVHVVEPGQTLWRIAAAYGIDVETLMRANDITDPTTLEVGRALDVPGATRVVAVPPPPISAPEEKTGIEETAASTIYAWPLSGEVLSRFGDKRGARKHRGIDIRGERGEPVTASRDGVVVLSADTRGGYGRTVVLDHGDGYRSLYAHNDDLLVKAGDVVQAGTPIARVGKTGNATTDHLHFEIRKGNEPIDPLPFLGGVLEARR